MTPNQTAIAGLIGRTRLIRDTESEITSLLSQALDDVVALLAKQPSDYQSWYLPQLANAIRRTLTDFGYEAGAAATNGQASLWKSGERLTPDVLASGGVRMILPLIDQTQLRAMSSFLTEKISSVTISAANKINTQLGLVVIGSQTPFDAIKAVQEILGESERARAGVIVRTELARAYSTANQIKMTQAAEADPGLGLAKRWVKSGKLHPRAQHALINGQTQPVAEPFLLYGGTVKIMYPHDPAAPAKETVNCGCCSVPIVSGWVSHTED